MLVEKLPDNWQDAADINSLRALDRPFVFPGNFFLNFMLPFESMGCFPFGSCSI